ncbi:hypothetical protein OJAV_G00114360 [Oryzias javanicus]|uniref:Uncharacterized protein n=1 Tax=Oryzias javanicus TaxID=123683 RepID=A0A437CWY7_ORYJA|nr:hypothetical protein OJAV_G00114360 [Oryzias javanicus]
MYEAVWHKTTVTYSGSEELKLLDSGPQGEKVAMETRRTSQRSEDVSSHHSGAAKSLKRKPHCWERSGGRGPRRCQAALSCGQNSTASILTLEFPGPAEDGQ